MKFEPIARPPQVDADAIQVTRLFPTPLATLVVPDHDRLDAALKRAILDNAARSAGVRFTNEGGWQSAHDFLAWSGPAGAELVAFARAYANELSAVSLAEGGLVHASLDWQLTVWANVNRKGDANALHGHPGAYWSGVYWVDDGREEGIDVGGELVFNDPRGLAPTLFAPNLKMRIAGCLSAGLTHAVQPMRGTFAIFPSWLLHSVTRYDGNRERISIAFNFAP